MAQADYDIASNPSGLALRLEVNEIFKAIQTINSGATPPSSTEAGMWWGDISDPNTYYLKMRNHTNDGWVNLYAYDVATSTIRALSNNKYLAEITGTGGAVFLPSGTTAQRPTLTSSERGLRYNTDNAELEFWDGTAWDSVGGDLDINALTDKTTPDNTDNIVLQESGGLLKKLSWSNLKADIGNTLLTEYTVTGSATTSINFSGLDINRHNSYYIEIDLVASGAMYMYMYINGDSTLSNYSAVILQGNGSTASSALSTTPSIGEIQGAGNFNKNITLNSVNQYPRWFCSSQRAVGFIQQISGVKTASVSNITQLTFVSSATLGLGVGTKVRIYRGDK